MKFSLIYADPPWAERGGGQCNRGASRHYPLMPTTEIAALPVQAVAADDALLLLWTTSNFLPGALDVVKAWGFRYVTQRIWIKVNAKGEPSTGLGQWLRLGHEHLLLCRRGDVPVPPPHLRAPSVILAPRGRHSEKPTEVRSWAGSIAPAGPRLELFARECVLGWTCLGNEIDGTDMGDSLRQLVAATEEYREAQPAPVSPANEVEQGQAPLDWLAAF